MSAPTPPVSDIPPESLPWQMILIAVAALLVLNAITVAKRAARRGLFPLTYFVSALVFPFWTDIESRMHKPRRKKRRPPSKPNRRVP